MRKLKRKVIVRYLGSNSTLGEEDCFKGETASMSFKCHSITAIVYKIKASVFKCHIDRNITAKEILRNQIKMREEKISDFLQAKKRVDENFPKSPLLSRPSSKKRIYRVDRSSQPPAANYDGILGNDQDTVTYTTFDMYAKMAPPIRRSSQVQRYNKDLAVGIEPSSRISTKSIRQFMARGKTKRAPRTEMVSLERSKSPMCRAASMTQGILKRKRDVVLKKGWADD